MAIGKVKARPVLVPKLPVVKVTSAKGSSSERTVSTELKNKRVGYKIVYVAGFLAGIPTFAFNKSVNGVRAATAKIGNVLSHAASKTAAFVQNTVSSAFTLSHAIVYAPIANRVARVANWTDSKFISPCTTKVQTVCKKNLATIGTLPARAANWTDAKIVRPVVNAVKSVASFINTKVVQPVSTKALTCVKWINSKICAPVVQLVQNSFKAVFVNVPTFLYKKAIAPAVTAVVTTTKNVAKAIWTRALLPVVQFVQNRIVAPALKGIKMATNALFVQLPTMVKNGCLFTVKKLYDGILSPIAKTVSTVCKAIFSPVRTAVAFSATKLYEKVVSPVVRTVTAVANKIIQFIRTYVVNPVIAGFQSFSQTIKNVSVDTEASLNKLMVKAISALSSGFTASSSAG